MPKGILLPKQSFLRAFCKAGKWLPLSPYRKARGYAVVTADQAGAFYYAGVVSSKPTEEGTEEVLFPKGLYLVVSGKGGLSRLAFDKLEDQAFHEILSGDIQYRYTGGPVAEVLLNGNPMDAEAEIWVPVEEK